MVVQHLTDEEVKGLMARAREIAARAAGSDLPADTVEHYATAAEEVGIPRDAMLEALRERLPVERGVSVGEMVFAPSADGRLYIARVSALGEPGAQVEFLHGGEFVCPPGLLRPLELLPGRRLEGKIKDWGWYPVKILSYDAGRGKVRVAHDDWTGTEETLPLAKLRVGVQKPKTRSDAAVEGARGILLRGLAVGLALGGVLGILVGRFLFR